MTPEERRIIEKIVERLYESVIKQMKEIKPSDFFGWKG